MLFALVLGLHSSRASDAKSFTINEAIPFVREPHVGIGNMSPMATQVDCRLAALWENGYEVKPTDLSRWHEVVIDVQENIYGRLCAASFLLETDLDARAFVENQLASKNIRYRFNAAHVLFEFEGASPNAKDWQAHAILQHLFDGSLAPGVRDDRGNYPDGDAWDANESQVGLLYHRLGTLKARNVAPVLLENLTSDSASRGLIIEVLGKLGDPVALPFLLQELRQGNVEAITPLGELKCKEAVPLILPYLEKDESSTPNQFDSSRGMALRALGEIGDERAVPPLQLFLHEAHPARQLLIARLALIKLNSPDPVEALTALLNEQKDLPAGYEVLRALIRYPDPRVVQLLTAIAKTSDSTQRREHAIQCLTEMKTRGALLALVSLLDETFPATLKKDARQDSPDTNVYLHRRIFAGLKYTTKQDFGQNPVLWQNWIKAHYPG